MPKLFVRNHLSFSLACAIVTATTLYAQSSQPVAPAPATPGAPLAVDVQNILAKVDQSAQAAALDIAKLRIEKWKTDSKDKEQAQSSADSLQRNMTAALPTLTNGVRTAPQDFATTFKLYRNLNALYDVLKTLTESAGAFGPKQEFESLAQYTEAFDQYRRSLGDYMENLAASKDAELNRLRAQTRARQVAPPPKKVIIDDETPEPAPKKKPKRKPATTQPAPTNPQ